MHSRRSRARTDPRSRKRTRNPDQIKYRSLMSLGVLSLLLVLANGYLFYEQRGLEEQLEAQQLFINRTVPVSRLNTQLVQLLASTAASTGDEGIKRLLSSQGIEYSVKKQER